MSKRNRMSVATIDSPEFINITSMSNPLISKCEVKVLYVGENRNRSYITKEVATEMARTLPGCPIVGYYIENKEDFGDHGDQVIIDGEGVKFKKLTKPYGFVAPDSKIWFQKFEDTDEFGNTVVREYLMTEGYLWTGQFEEAKRVIDSGNPQSMELDEKTLKGYWSTDNNRGIDFFIINDAIFSKLCILGEDVEPCFEGANITAPKLSTEFSKDDSFSVTLFSMLKELKSTLSEGGTDVSIKAVENIGVEIDKKFSAEQDKVSEIDTHEIDNNIGEFKKAKEEEDEKSDSEEDAKSEDASEDSDDKEEDKKKKPAANHTVTEFEADENGEGAENSSDENAEDNTEGSEEPAEDPTPEEEPDVPEEDVEEPVAMPYDGNDNEGSKKLFALEEELNELKNAYALLEQKCADLENYKANIENAKKDELIKSFYMLSDEDKADVIANKANYSLDDIEAKLSVICVRKKVSFDLNEDSNEEKSVATYNLNTIESIDVPDIVSTLRDVRKSYN